MTHDLYFEEGDNDIVSVHVHAAVNMITPNTPMPSVHGIALYLEQYRGDAFGSVHAHAIQGTHGASSMGVVEHFLEGYRQDILWSFLSDAFFIVGGISYVLLSVPHFHLYPENSLFHSALNVFAPSVYLVNSFVDVAWARQIQSRHRSQRQMMIMNQRQQEHPYWDTFLGEYLATSGEDSFALLNDASSPSSLPNWFTGCYKHEAHRRTLLAAWTFGIAAFFGVVAVISTYMEQPRGDLFGAWLGGLSVHVYILSAIISISGQRTRPWLGIGTYNDGIWWWDKPEVLEDMGDLLFFVGSLVDGVLCDFTFDDDRPGWAMLSACLWLVDACFYLQADFVMASHLNRLSKLHVPGECAEVTLI